MFLNDHPQKNSQNRVSNTIHYKKRRVQLHFFNVDIDYSYIFYSRVFKNVAIDHVWAVFKKRGCRYIFCCVLEMWLKPPIWFLSIATFMKHGYRFFFPCKITNSCPNSKPYYKHSKPNGSAIHNAENILFLGRYEGFKYNEKIYKTQQ